MTWGPSRDQLLAERLNLSTRPSNYFLSASAVKSGAAPGREWAQGGGRGPAGSNLVDLVLARSGQDGRGGAGRYERPDHP